MKHRIVVLGAGYTGAVAAGRLARRLHGDDVQLTVVNAEPDFVERVRMHELAAGRTLKPRPLAEVFKGTDVVLRVAKVAAVDVDQKLVTLDDGGELGYDTLVYALGSRVNDHGVPGVSAYAEQIAGRPGALRVRAKLAALKAGQTVTVVGGGLTGIEGVTEIAEARPDLNVALVAAGGLGDWVSAKGQRHLRKVFAGLGITVHEHTKVTRVEADAVVTAAGTTIPSALTIWTTGFAVHPIAAATSLGTAASGQILVDDLMASVSHPDVYAIGDAAQAKGSSGQLLRMSCASGTFTAYQAADAIAARLTGGKLPHTMIRYFQQCISLGRNEGLIQFVTAGDRTKQSALRGRAAVIYKELICWGAYVGVANPTLGMPVRRRHLTTRPTHRTATR
ncbi:FAD-dependent oxidoreductase [Kribbella sandramycini]|uniref:FAD-dependent oxidoreductase n=1 Tax=Kribbella sandramycini TaxID=60450 RepID=A0A7Y4P201_9ACTN|nr:FAD-dependent oxidoreductase [Kribbella sandramycini]MBB6571641.1 NADH dehydrogenase FAD-containing subunit [Kribbella sandramycini]NOL44286.1 FAD-dependent oxidoreductase [Kribbella sandramycini]